MHISASTLLALSAFIRCLVYSTCSVALFSADTTADCCPRLRFAVGWSFQWQLGRAQDAESPAALFLWLLCWSVICRENCSQGTEHCSIMHCAMGLAGQEHVPSATWILSAAVPLQPRAAALLGFLGGGHIGGRYFSAAGTPPYSHCSALAKSYPILSIYQDNALLTV